MSHHVSRNAPPIAQIAERIPAAESACLPPHLAHWPRRLPRHLVLPETSLWFKLEVSAARYPGKAAYLSFGRAITYAALKQQAEQLAGWLQAHGVAKGDRVAVFMQYCPQFVVAVHAVLRADAVVVPVNPMNKADEFGHCITDPGTRVVLTTADLAGVVAEADARLPAAQRLQHIGATRFIEALPSVINAAEAPSDAVLQWLRADPDLSGLDAPITRWADALAAGHTPGPHRAQPDDMALLPYTSGTTGLPKGCIHSHRTLMHNVIGGAQWGHGGPEVVSLGVVPMFHITGMVYGALGPVAAGSTTVILPRWDRELAGRLIARHQVTHWTCIPTMIIDLFGSPAYQSNLPERAKLQCLGIPIFGVDSRIIDPDTLRVLPAGETGEIVSHGPMLFKGYWGHPEATAAAFTQIDGKAFFRTGDLGRMDDEGYFFITDRLKRMINASGFKVWPSEVELLLFKCPLVQEACIIASCDAYRGETVKAVIVLRAEARGRTTAEDIMAWAREHMAAYKVPRIVEFIEALPKSGSGKVMWRLLQERDAA